MQARRSDKASVDVSQGRGRRAMQPISFGNFSSTQPEEYSSSEASSSSSSSSSGTSNTTNTVTSSWADVVGTREAASNQSSVIKPTYMQGEVAYDKSVIEGYGIEFDEAEVERLNKYEAFCRSSERLGRVPDLVALITPNVAACMLTIHNAIARAIKEQAIPTPELLKRAKIAARKMKTVAEAIEQNKENTSPFQWLLEIGECLIDQRYCVEVPGEIFKALHDTGTEFVKKMDPMAWAPYANVHDLRTVVWGLRRWCVIPFLTMFAGDSHFETCTRLLRENTKYLNPVIQLSDLVIRLMVGDLSVDSVSAILKRAVELCFPTHDPSGTRSAEDERLSIEIKQKIADSWDRIVTPILQQNWESINGVLAENKKLFYDNGGNLRSWKGKFLYGCAYALSLLPLVEICITEEMQQIITDKYANVVREASRLLAGMARDFLTGAVEASLQGLLSREDIWDLASLIFIVAGEENKKKFLSHISSKKDEYKDLIDPAFSENVTTVFSTLNDRFANQTPQLTSHPQQPHPQNPTPYQHPQQPYQQPHQQPQPQYQYAQQPYPHPHPHPQPQPQYQYVQQPYPHPHPHPQQPHQSNQQPPHPSQNAPPS